MFQYDPEHRLIERVEAERAVLKDGRWELESAWVSAVGQEPEFYKRYLLSTYLTPTQVPRQSRHGVLDLVLDLPNFIQIAERAGLPATQYRVQYQLLLSRPFLLVTMVLIAATCSLRGFRFGNVQINAVFGLAAGFAFFVFSEISRNFAMAGLTSAVAAAWVPVIVAASLALTAFVQRGRMMARARKTAMRRAKPGLPRLKAGCLRACAGAFRCLLAAFFAPLASCNGFRSGANLARADRPAPQGRPVGADAAAGRRARLRQRQRRVTAKGNVELYYGNYTLLADRVIYDRSANTLSAEGNVRIKDPAGAVITSDQITLTDDFRDGFIESLKLVTKDETRIVAASATRQAGNVTVFEKGWFTPCKPCVEKPDKAPTWRIRAGKITHKTDQAVIKFKNVMFDLFGVPVVWVPYFQMADPTVKRKSGFLMPSYSHSNELGNTVQIPYYFALSDHYDFTFAPMVTESGYAASGRLAPPPVERRLSHPACRCVG